MKLCVGHLVDETEKALPLCGLKSRKRRLDHLHILPHHLKMKSSNQNIKFAMILILLLGHQELNGHLINTEKSKQMYVPGDFILGGLFTLHVGSSGHRNSLADHGNECQGTFSSAAFQALQGMLMAVRDVNADHELLPGIRLGVDIKDTCGSVDLAVRESLNFSFVRKYFKQPSQCTNPQHMSVNGSAANYNVITENKFSRKEPETVAIIGPDLSEIARAVADLAGLFDIPVVSPSATSEFLSDRKRFKHFFRTVPSDSYQTRVIVDLLTYFKWNYVIMLTGDDEYGRAGRQALRERMETATPNICTVIDKIVAWQKVPQIIRDIKAQKKARVIILFTNLDHMMHVIEESRTQGLYGYTWIVSDAWTGARMIIEDNQQLLQGMLGVGPPPSDIPGFNAELLKIATNGSQHNVWAEEFLQYEKHACESKDVAQCIMGDSYAISPYVGSTIDAVYAVAHSLHSMLGCSKIRCKNSTKDFSNSQLFEFLKKVKFTGASGLPVSFDWFGSGSSSYQVMNLQKSVLGYEIKPVADWHYRSQDPNISTRFNWTSRYILNSKNTVPVSTCSADCRLGWRRRPQKIDPQCCWTCVECGGNTVANATSPYTCSKCPNGYWPDTRHITCLKIKDIYMKWDDTVIRVIITIACIGIGMVVFTAFVFMRFRTSPIVKAASRGMCCVLLLGVTLLYLLPFTLIGRPNRLMCRSLPFTLGLCLSLNVGTMLVKTNRIARIFSKRIMKSKVHFLSSKWLYLMVFIIVALEQLICLVWILALSPPDVEIGFNDQISRVLSCNFGSTSKGLAIWTSYNAGLILVCTYQAFLVRKVPHNYNEAKFIAFTMVSICITILVYIPVHVGAVTYSKDVICSFLYTFLATVEFICIFAPKLHIILLRPSKNIEMQISGSFDHGRSTRMSEVSNFEMRHGLRGSKRLKLEFDENISELNGAVYPENRVRKRINFIEKRRMFRGRRNVKTDDVQSKGIDIEMQVIKQISTLDNGRRFSEKLENKNGAIKKQAVSNSDNRVVEPPTLENNNDNDDERKQTSKMPMDDGNDEGNILPGVLGKSEIDKKMGNLKESSFSSSDTENEAIEAVQINSDVPYTNLEESSCSICDSSQQSSSTASKRDSLLDSQTILTHIIPEIFPKNKIVDMKCHVKPTVASFLCGKIPKSVNTALSNGLPDQEKMFKEDLQNGCSNMSMKNNPGKNLGLKTTSTHCVASKCLPCERNSCLPKPDSEIVLTGDSQNRLENSNVSIGNDIGKILCCPEAILCNGVVCKCQSCKVDSCFSNGESNEDQIVSCKDGITKCCLEVVSPNGIYDGCHSCQRTSFLINTTSYPAIILRKNVHNGHGNLCVPLNDGVQRQMCDLEASSANEIDMEYLCRELNSSGSDGVSEHHIIRKEDLQNTGEHSNVFMANGIENGPKLTENGHVNRDFSMEEDDILCNDCQHYRRTSSVSSRILESEIIFNHTPHRELEKGKVNKEFSFVEDDSLCSEHSSQTLSMPHRLSDSQSMLNHKPQVLSEKGNVNKQFYFMEEHESLGDYCPNSNRTSSTLSELSSSESGSIPEHINPRIFVKNADQMNQESFNANGISNKDQCSKTEVSISNVNNASGTEIVSSQAHPIFFVKNPDQIDTESSKVNGTYHQGQCCKTTVSKPNSNTDSGTETVSSPVPSILLVEDTADSNSCHFEESHSNSKCNEKQRSKTMNCISNGGSELKQEFRSRNSQFTVCRLTDLEYNPCLLCPEEKWSECEHDHNEHARLCNGTEAENSRRGSWIKLFSETVRGKDRRSSESFLLQRSKFRSDKESNESELLLNKHKKRSGSAS